MQPTQKIVHLSLYMLYKVWVDYNNLPLNQDVGNLSYIYSNQLT